MSNACERGSQPPTAENHDPDRRRFFSTAASAAALALIPGVTFVSLAGARSPDQPVTDERRWGMLIDTNKCAEGCDACVRGCVEEHGLWGHDRPETDAQWIRKVTVRDKLTGRVTSLPLMCQHCKYPPCVDVCPTGASFRRPDGIVLVDKHICIGCRYCMMACPYKARSFIHETLTEQKPYAPRGKGTVESCTLCVHRVDEGGERIPACAEACNAAGHRAMLFGDLNDPESELSRSLVEYGSEELRADMGLHLGVRYRGL
ncbi:MAG: sulfate reduction electron transfer complex DsrMKJOP subunit DsrO [Gammaproteobacteria bacterium]